MASGTVLWPHNHCVPSQPLCLTLCSMYFWHYTECTNFMKRRECMSSQPLYVSHPMHCIWHHIHSLWLHTIVVITLHPLHSWHHTPNIWHNKYGNMNIISAIWPSISNTTSTVCVSANPGYQLYHTHSLYDITHTIHVTSYSVCMLSQLFRTLHTSMYNFTPSIFMISYPVCMLSPYCFHDNTTTIPEISPTIFDITVTVSVSSQDGTHICIDVSPYWWHHNKCVSHHTWHTYDIIPNLYPITFTLYDINDHVLWHHIHGIHDIRSPLYDITSTL